MMIESARRNRAVEEEIDPARLREARAGPTEPADGPGLIAIEPRQIAEEEEVIAVVRLALVRLGEPAALLGPCRRLVGVEFLPRAEVAARPIRLPLQPGLDRADGGVILADRVVCLAEQEK